MILKVQKWQADEIKIKSNSFKASVKCHFYWRLKRLKNTFTFWWLDSWHWQNRMQNKEPKPEGKLQWFLWTLSIKNEIIREKQAIKNRYFKCWKVEHNKWHFKSQSNWLQWIKNYKRFQTILQKTVQTFFVQWCDVTRIQRFKVYKADN